MSLSGNFNPQGLTLNLNNPASGQPPRRPAPFSLRLSEPERARLMEEAAGTPLGSYIKAKVLDGTVPIRMRRTGLGIQDRTALAQLVAILGRSRMASNLNQLAHLANIGALALTPDIEDELKTALADVREMRRLLLAALGLKSEATP